MIVPTRAHTQSPMASKRRPHDRVDVDHVALDAFGLADELEAGPGHWHAHRVDQILYVASGALRLELDDTTWSLPSARAAFIRAGTMHRVDVLRPAALRTCYLSPVADIGTEQPCTVFTVSPLCREMLVACTAWGPDHDASGGADPAREPFFQTIAAFVPRWLESPLPFALPRARSSELQRATRYLLAHLAEPTELEVDLVARHARLSTRTLARRFVSETGLTMRGWLHQARMLLAIELLAEPDTAVTDVALRCGYSSLPTFSRSFAAFVGETPLAFGKALRAASPT